MRHRFKRRCYNATTLLEDCNKLSTFMSRLAKQSELYPHRRDPMTYRGDGFEALVEVLIKCSPIDKRINITEYKPWAVSSMGPDMGIDGVGTSHNGRPHAVQVKYRSDPNSMLTANKDHISNFVAKSESVFGSDRDMTIFTTARGLLDPVNDGIYNGRVRTLGYAELSKLIDGNLAFWDAFRTELGS